MFSDIAGSTRLWETDRSEMETAVARHDEVVRAAVQQHHGIVFATAGDGFAVAFARAGGALSCAVEVERALDEAGLPPVRIGIHTGEADERDGDYFGPTVNRTARLMAIGHGGQILVSHATEQLARDTLGAESGLVDLGEHRLRDLSRPERVFQLCSPGLPAEFPPLVSMDAFPGNLPLQVSPFIGRERELARVADAIEQTRVVTLTGVGGVGKTRLALQVAGEVLPTFREGAWLVELAAVRDPDGVVDAFAAVFGVAARIGQSLVASLVEFLATKRLLLVVDNCEHLLDEVAELVETIERSCAGVTVLATSREGLALDGERVVPVPSLMCPRVDADLDAIAGCDAVRLFVERARSVDPDFALTAENASAVGQICRRLDGVPLAVQLAAARVSTMNPAELVRGLDRRFDMLAGGRRRAVQRHQTLRAAIDWSYDLCAEPERRLLARLAVFAGGCTRDAAEAVCACPPIEVGHVFEPLTALVARSLVVAERDRPETRYRLLETIREYGEERLAEYVETDELRTRHAEYYVEFAHRVDEQIRGPAQIEAGQRLIAENENLLAAMNYAIDTDNADVALRLVRYVWAAQWQAAFDLGIPIRTMLELTGADQHPLFPFALEVAGNLAGLQGDTRTANSLLDDALDAAERLGDVDRHVEQHVWVSRTAIAFASGKTHEAAEHAQHAAEVARATNNVWLLASELGAAATFYAMAGEADQAVKLATEGLAIARRLQTPLQIVSNLAALAAALSDQDPEQASELLSESIQLRTTLGYESWQDVSQATLISARLEEWQQTLTLAAQSIRYLHWNGDWPLLAAILNVTARALADIDAESAATLQGVAGHLLVLAATTYDTRRSDDAGDKPSHMAPRPADDRDYVTQLRRHTTTILRETLGDQLLRELRAQGEEMDRDDAVAYALTAISTAT
jgi:predicted ATPase